jgi:hypothetical protein
LNGRNGEATNSDDVKGRGIDRKQNSRIAQLENALRRMRLKKPKPNAKGSKKKRKSPKKKVSKDHSHILRSDHGSVIAGLMDSVPTAPVLVRGSTSNSMVTGNYFIYMGHGQHFSDQSITTTAFPNSTGVIKPIVGRSWNVSPISTLRPTSQGDSSGTPSTQYAVVPYGTTDSFKTKVNKITLHVSYAGSQTLMTAELRVFVDYHGDILCDLIDESQVQGYPTLVQIYDRIYNHPRVIKIKVDSGSSIDYVLPFPTAQLYGTSPMNIADWNTVWAGATGTMQACLANTMALNDNRSGPGLYKAPLNAPTTGNVYGFIDTPLVYVVGVFPTSANITVNTTMDVEYHDESLYSVSKPSVCDSLTATALHTLAMAAHHDSTTVPLHKKGIKFKDVVRKAAKAEHVAQTLSASPLGQAVITAALA